MAVCGWQSVVEHRLVIASDSAVKKNSRRRGRRISYKPLSYRPRGARQLPTAHCLPPFAPRMAVRSSTGTHQHSVNGPVPRCLPSFEGFGVPHNSSFSWIAAIGFTGGRPRPQDSTVPYPRYVDRPTAPSNASMPVTRSRNRRKVRDAV